MESKKIILLLSHCLLNQEVRAEELTPHPEALGWIGKILEEFAVGIYQMRCPEFEFLGRRRKMRYDEYANLKGFKEHCEKIAEEVANYVNRLSSSHVVVVGIARSPSCSLSKVNIEGRWIEGKGIFMESLQKSVKASFLEWDYECSSCSYENLKEYLKSMLK